MKKRTILFLAANPGGTDPLALDREARAIQAELDRSGFRDCFELVTRWAVEPLDLLDLLDLLRELRKLRPTVVHFSGHGARGAPGEGGPAPASRPAVSSEAAPREAELEHGLYLRGAGGRAQLVSTAAPEETFGATGASVRLVVLNAC